MNHVECVCVCVDSFIGTFGELVCVVRARAYEKEKNNTFVKLLIRPKVITIATLQRWITLPAEEKFERRCSKTWSNHCGSALIIIPATKNRIYICMQSKVRYNSRNQKMIYIHATCIWEVCKFCMRICVECCCNNFCVCFSFFFNSKTNKIKTD